MLERGKAVLGELPQGAIPLPLARPSLPLTLSLRQLEERDPSGSDPEQMAHVKELMGKLDAAGIVASTGAEGEDGDWEDASDEDAMEE